MNKAMWSLVVLVPAGAAAVWFATRGPESVDSKPEEAKPVLEEVAPTPVEPPRQEAYDPGKPTPEISAERKAVEAIGKKKEYSRENETRLVKALDHIDQDVRGHGAWGIGELAPKTRGAIGGLVKSLGDEVWAVQHNAAWAISRFDRADVEGLLVQALEDKLATRRIRAAKALLDLDTRTFTPKVESVLLKAYDEAQAQPRTVALQAMGQLSPPSESTIALISGAISSEDDAIVTHAVAALGDLGPASQAAVPVLVSVHKHKKQDVRRGVAQSLAKIGVKSALVFDTLIAMLDDAKDGPADEAAQALAKLEAWDALDQAFATQGPRTRKFIVSAWRIGTSEEPRRVAKLIEALADVDPGVRLAAAGGFLERDVAEAVPALVKALGDTDNAVAGHSRTALERMSNPAAKAALAGGKP